jgi:hypothetical protein
MRMYIALSRIYFPFISMIRMISYHYHDDFVINITHDNIGVITCVISSILTLKLISDIDVRN